MEVHHPHHPTHKKKWSEYIIEFVMLFAAVTLGFFAENVREHQIIEHKTKQNLMSIILDLKKDSALIQNRLAEYKQASMMLENLSDLTLSYHLSKISKNEFLDSALNIGYALRFGTSFYINNSSYKNTIASGSFSNINSIELKRNISDYYEVYGAKLNDNNRLLDDFNVYYNQYTFPLPGGRSQKNKENGKRKLMKDFYLSNQMMDKYLLNKDFLTFNQQAKGRADIYFRLMEAFNEKNTELLKLLANEL
jgi:hypothetical protein